MTKRRNASPKDSNAIPGSRPAPGEDQRSHQPVGRDSFVQLLRAEFTKFLTARSWMIALGAAAGVFVLLAFLSALASHANNPAVPTGPGGEAVTDTYTFVHKPLAGDGSLTARITSISGAQTSSSNTSGNRSPASSKDHSASQLQPGPAPWAKAGLILEPDTNRGTAYAAVMITGSHGVRMQSNYTHDTPELAGPARPDSPQWLRLTRLGDVITGYDSRDGAHWTKIATARLTGLPQTIQLGLFVTSPVGATDGTLSAATASFDHISTQGDLPHRSWTGAAIADGFYPYLPSADTWQQRSSDAFTISGTGDIAPLVGGSVLPHWSGASIVNGTIAALLIVIVLATRFATAEHRRGLIRTPYVAPPPAGRILLTKAIVAGSLAFTAGAIATAIAEVITRHVFAANGNYLFPQSAPAVAQVIVGTGLFLGIAAALVVALGTMLRRSTMTVVAGFLLLILPGILATTMPGDPQNWLMRLTPTAAFAVQATLPRFSQVSSTYTIANGYFPISPWAGLAVPAAYTAIALSAALWLVHRRDA
jgi:ABC-type transport system involved in multi-copper enzyme maturation permease subunit